MRAQNESKKVLSEKINRMKLWGKKTQLKGCQKSIINYFLQGIDVNVIIGWQSSAVSIKLALF